MTFFHDVLTEHCWASYGRLQSKAAVAC